MRTFPHVEGMYPTAVMIPGELRLILAETYRPPCSKSCTVSRCLFNMKGVRVSNPNVCPGKYLLRLRQFQCAL